MTHLVPPGRGPILAHKTLHIVVVTFPQPSLAPSYPLSPSPESESDSQSESAVFQFETNPPNRKGRPPKHLPSPESEVTQFKANPLNRQGRPRRREGEAQYNRGRRERDGVASVSRCAAQPQARFLVFSQISNAESPQSSQPYAPRREGTVIILLLLVFYFNFVYW